MIKIKNSLPPEYNLRIYKEVASTMVTAKNLVNSGSDVGTVVWAKKQTNGRGRYGRTRISPAGNLYFSFIRNAEMENKRFLFSHVYIVGLTLAESVEEISNGLIKPFLKWPNDLLINGSKLAGILIESFISDSNQNLLNIGLGININSSPDNVGYKTTNLKKENVNIKPKELLVYFFQCLKRNEKNYNKKGLNFILKKWKNYSHTKNDKLLVKIGNTRLKCLFKDIDKNGALLLEISDKKIKTVYAGDVFLL